MLTIDSGIAVLELLTSYNTWKHNWYLIIKNKYYRASSYQQNP